MKKRYQILSKRQKLFIFFYLQMLAAVACSRDNILLPIPPDTSEGPFENSILVSGQPLKVGSTDGIGRFALESIAMHNMGMAKVDGDDYYDMFLSSDSWHPGTYLYFSKGFTANNEPVFSQAQKINMPYDDNGKVNARIYQSKDGNIYCFWHVKGKISMALFDAQQLSFTYVKTFDMVNLPKWPHLGYFGVEENKDGKLVFFFTIREDGVFNGPSRGEGVEPYTPEGFWPYPIPGVGIYGAVLSSLEEDQLTAQELTGLKETSYAFENFTLYEVNNQQYLIAGSYLGNFLVYPLSVSSNNVIELGAKRYVVDNKGIIQRNPALHSDVVYYKNTEQGLIVVSEGGIYFYAETGELDQKGNIVFEEPVHLMQESANLYGGSLVVPNLVDWDGDGIIDIISGTSTGEVWFFKNKGTDLDPSFQNPQALRAGGKVIKIQPGYREDIQGPGEARWGYTTPTVFDWNNDGLYDILMCDSRGKFMVYINKGTQKNPILEVEKPLYLKGLDMHGAWRVKPGVAQVGDSTMYICLDTDDELHLYWKIDDYNLEEGGKLKLSTGENIQANYQNAGAVGRSRINVFDWDEDGVLDLVIGLPKWGSMPHKTNGIPFYTAEKAATVVFLKNVGTNHNPVYEYPKVIKFKGNSIRLGGHECGPAIGKIGGTTDNLIVGIEQGHYIFYDRKDLSW